jgi:hypothetical protein
MARLTDPKTGLILTSLTPEILPLCAAYIARFIDGENKREHIPTMAGLAIHLGISKKTLYNWKDQQQENESYSEMMEILEFLNTNQEVITVNGGLNGVFNSGIVKIILGNHGYVESSKVDSTSSDGSMTPAPNVIEIVAPDFDD